MLEMFGRPQHVDPFDNPFDSGHGSEYEQVRRFHTHFDLPVRDEPMLLPEELAAQRVQFIEEELEEFIHAHNSGNIVKAADALLDLVYVIKGTAVMMGLPWDPMWEVVQQANMRKTKVDGDGSHKLGVRKPDGWVGPEDGLKIAIEAARYRAIVRNSAKQMKTPDWAKELARQVEGRPE